MLVVGCSVQCRRHTSFRLRAHVLATHPLSKLKFFPPMTKQNSSIKSVKLAGKTLSANAEPWQLALGLEWPQWEQSKSINQCKVCGNLLTTHLCALSALDPRALWTRGVEVQGAGCRVQGSGCFYRWFCKGAAINWPRSYCLHFACWPSSPPAVTINCSTL